MESIILIGGGGHCKSCIDVIEQEGKFNIAGIVEKHTGLEQVLGYPIIGCDDDLPELISKYKNVLITVGQIKSAKIRMKLFDICKNQNANFPVIISPRAYVSKHAKINEGTIVLHNAIVNAESHIGKGCIINSLALVEHECHVGDFCHISTASCINGQSIIRNESFIGSNAVIGNNVTISSRCIISAGSRIFKNLTQEGTYVGEPLRRV